ncbi:MAG: CcmD family protein [Bacteroidetes bacterium]|nr:MAG: CcmD family protein [Bacteroidota bacterium]
MRIIKTLLLFVTSLLSSALIYAQQEEKADMADTMRSNGRIYVVVAVVVVILLGLILYLIRLDRKISRMESDKESK